MSKRLCIIPCGAKKIWDLYPNAKATKAQYVYKGVFHNSCQTYARTFFGEDWVILSAKHGFLLPNDIVPENYNVEFGTKNPDVLRLEELREQLVAKGLKNYDEVTVFAGKKYTSIVKEVFDQDVRIVLPLADCKGIGYMLQKLNNAVKSKTECM